MNLKQVWTLSAHLLIWISDFVHNLSPFRRGFSFADCFFGFKKKCDGAVIQHRRYFFCKYLLF